VVSKDSRVFTVRRSTVVRIGIAALVLVALGAGTAIGLAVGSKSSPQTNESTGGGGATNPANASTTTVPQTTSTVAALPGVLSCGPGSTTSVRPTRLTIGCASGAITVTAITWSAWGAATGGQGTGTLNAYSLSEPAIVVVFHDVNGVFQDVSITPSQGVSATPTTSTTSSTSGPTTTTTTGGLSPIAASQPGSGWGGS
jgi:hypothetical protein